MASDTSAKQPPPPYYSVAPGAALLAGPRRPWVLPAGVLLALLLLLLAFQGGSAPPTLPPLTQSSSKGAADMHVHTSESDADRTAAAQIERAAALGLAALWVTDHDLIREAAHARALIALGAQHGVTVGVGVEITVALAGKEHHLLGYFPDAAWAPAELDPPLRTLQAACARVKASRESRNTALSAHLVAQLSPATSVYYAAGRTPPPDLQAALAVAKIAAWAMAHAGLAEPASLGRPHYRAYLRDVLGVRDDLIFGPRNGSGRGVLLTSGAVVFDGDGNSDGQPSVEALLHSATLARRGIAFEPLAAVDAVALITAAGGRAVVAHPPTLGADFATLLAGALPELVAAGLWGLEAFSSEVGAAPHATIAALAATHNLHLTGGSDNHGSLKPYALLGAVHRAGAAPYAELAEWAARGARQSDALRARDQDFVY